MLFDQAVFNAVRRATLRICRERPVIAIAETAYVTDGPKVQYDAHATSQEKISTAEIIRD